MAIYKLDDVGMPILDTVAIGNTPEYYVLMKQNMGSKGDADGRKKRRNKQTLAFIWHYCDYNSDGVQQGLSGDELLEYARKQSGLPTGWEMDSDVEAAVARYLTDSETVIIRLNKNLLRSFHGSDKTLSILNTICDRKIMELEDIMDSTDVEDRQTVNDHIAFIVSTQKEIQEISKTLPDRINQSTKYKELLARETEDVKEGLANSIIPNSAMP